MDKIVIKEICKNLIDGEKSDFKEYLKYMIPTVIILSVVIFLLKI